MRSRMCTTPSTKLARPRCEMWWAGFPRSAIGRHAQRERANQKCHRHTHTEPWGAQVTAVEVKDITLPENMQRAMAREAEAERERRAKIVAAEGEYQAAVKLGEAADIITQHPVALQLRTLQTMAEISVEKNSTIIFPAQFMTTVREAIALMSG